MKEWHRTVILTLLLVASIALLVWSRSASVPTFGV